MKCTIVGCSAKKHTKSAPAKDFCETNRLYWNVISAKHGLVEPVSVIHPYDLTIPDLYEAHRSSLVARVRYSLSVRVPLGDTLEPLCGRDYCQVIEEAAAGRWRISRPMQGLGIGKQLQWLKANAKEAA